MEMCEVVNTSESSTVCVGEWRTTRALAIEAFWLSILFSKRSVCLPTVETSCVYCETRRERDYDIVAVSNKLPSA